MLSMGIKNLLCKTPSGSPDCRASHPFQICLLIIRALSSPKGYIEVVKNTEKIINRFVRFLHWPGSLGPGYGTNKTGWGREITRKTDHTASTSQRSKIEIFDFFCRKSNCREIYIITQIGHMPIVAGRISDNAQRVELLFMCIFVLFSRQLKNALVIHHKCIHRESRIY